MKAEREMSKHKFKGNSVCLTSLCLPCFSKPLSSDYLIVINEGNWTYLYCNGADAFISRDLLALLTSTDSRFPNQPNDTDFIVPQQTRDLHELQIWNTFLFSIPISEIWVSACT